MDIDTFLGRLHRLPDDCSVILTFKPEASSAGVKLFMENILGPAAIAEPDLRKLESVYESESWDPLPDRQVEVIYLSHVDLRELAALGEHIENVTPADDLFQKLLAHSEDSLKVIFMRTVKSPLLSLTEEAARQKIKITCSHGFEGENPDYPIAEVTFMPLTGQGEAVQCSFYAWGSLIKVKGRKDVFTITCFDQLNEVFGSLLKDASQPVT